MKKHITLLFLSITPALAHTTHTAHTHAETNSSLLIALATVAFTICITKLASHKK